MSEPATPVVLSAGGASLVLDATGPGVPRVLHWGADLGALDPVAAGAFIPTAEAGLPHAVADQSIARTLLPAEADGWLGRPAVHGHRDGTWSHPRWTLTEPVTVRREDGGTVLALRAADADAEVSIAGELRLEAPGVLRVRYRLTNDGASTWTLEGLSVLLPVPDQAGEVLGLTGHWCREKSPQRHALTHGTHARESRRGRTGHDATGVLVAGTPGFGFRHGEVWGVHVAWSGNHVHLVERLAEGATALGGGELLGPGEVRLEPGESYESPWVAFVYSARGLDGLSAALHRWLRSRPHHPASPRPVVLNTWEAVYFDHRLDRLTALAERAAQIGVERFVLDDGWFLGRRDDTAGLGDWYVDPAVWPEGLHPLVGKVRALGMEFGLWVEPEMVNPDSDLARAHPDWLLTAPSRPAPSWRHQQVLDLARPEAWEYVLARLDALVSEYAIDFLKWDHNRDLHEAVHDGVAGVHRQTVATYRLLDELRRRHPALEIESCSSGGARVDLGILDRTDRVWASDTNDPVERQMVQRWTGLLLPPELIGSHVGPERSETTGRRTDLGFRCATALFGHAGLEWDLTSCSESELAELADWVRLYRRLRSLLHTGEVVRADHPDPSALLHGVVATERDRAVFAFVQLTSSATSVPARMRLPGLDPDRTYRVGPCPELPPPTGGAARQPAWLTAGGGKGDAAGGAVLPGRVLDVVGLPAPLLFPAQAAVFEATATDAR